MGSDPRALHMLTTHSVTLTRLLLLCGGTLVDIEELNGRMHFSLRETAQSGKCLPCKKEERPEFDPPEPK